jgi:hypothetical protein
MFIQVTHNEGHKMVVNLANVATISPHCHGCLILFATDKPNIVISEQLPTVIKLINEVQGPA